MERLIREKAEQLKHEMPANPEFYTWMQNSDLWGFVYSLLKISGEKVHKTAVVNMVEGKIDENLSLSSYTLVQNWKAVFSDIMEYNSMQSSLDRSMITKWAGMLLGGDGATHYRNSACAVYEWEHIPPAETRIPAEIDAAVKEYNQSRDLLDPVSRMSKLHLKLNGIYAFGDDSVCVSMAVLVFCLKENGLPVPQLPLSDRDYNKLMADCIASGDISDFKNMLERSIYNRLEEISSLAALAKEKENG